MFQWLQGHEIQDFLFKISLTHTEVGVKNLGERHVHEERAMRSALMVATLEAGRAWPIR